MLLTVQEYGNPNIDLKPTATSGEKTIDTAALKPQERVGNGNTRAENSAIIANEEFDSKVSTTDQANPKVPLEKTKQLIVTPSQLLGCPKII